MTQSSLAPAVQAAVVMLLVCLMGCAKLPSDPKHEAPKPAVITDEEKFSLLDHEAKQRHLRYKIFCTAQFNGGREQYQADAEHIEAKPDAIYTDQGRMEEWMEVADTQADAAYLLYQSIQGPATHPQAGMDRPKWTKQALQCKRDIQGNWKYSPASKKAKP